MAFNGILYRKSGGTLELNRSVGSFCVVESAKLEDKWQDGGVVTLVLQTTEVLTFYSGDYIIAKGNRYLVCKTISEYRTLDDGRHQYTVPLHSPDALFKNALMYNTVEHEDGGVYSWSRPNNFIMELGSVEVLVKTCCYNVNEVMGRRVFKLGTIDASVSDEYRVINFSDNNCWAGLKQTCEHFDTFYTIRANTDETPDSDYIVDIGVEPGTFPETLQVGMRQGIAELTMNYADEDVYTQFVVLGSSENLPRGYEHERLQLDEDLMGTPPVYAGSLIVDESKYARWGRKRMELIFDDIKPTRIPPGTITSIPEDNIFAFYDTSLSEVLAFEENWNPVGGTVHILDGNLLGYTFEIIAFHSGTYKITIKQISDSNGLLLPNADNETFRFSYGMKYNLAGIALPNSYVVDAKTRLKAAAVNAINGYWTQPRASFSLTPDPFFLQSNELDITCGWLIPIRHDALEINKSLRVTSVTYDLLKDTYFDLDSVEVADITGKDNFMNSVHKSTQRSLNMLKVTTSIQNSVKNLDTYIDGAFFDGVISESEAAAIEKYINIVNSTKADIDAQFTTLYANFYLSGNAKTNLNTAKTALNTATANLLGSINTAISDGAASAAEKADVDAKFTAFNSALSTYQTRVEEANALIQTAMKTAAENAAKAYAVAQDISLKIETDAYTDGKVTAAEAAAIAAAEEKVNAAKVAMEAYADGEVTKEEERAIADANEKYEAALSYAESLSEGAATDATDKVNAAKDALAQKFGYANWAAMAVSVSLTGGLTTEDGLISANVIDVETLAAMDAFINELTVIKLQTAIDEDGTKVRIDADAVEHRAGILLEETTGNRGIKLYYKATNGAPIFYVYSTDTSEFLEFLANKMNFKKGTTRDVTIDSANSSLQLRNGTKYAHISPSELRVDDLPDEPVGTGKFWVDTATGIVHWGIVTPPSVTYSFDIQKTYPSGRSDIAASGGTATFTVKLKTITDGIPDAGVLVDLDTGYPSVTSSPTGTSFSITRTGTGTYSITAASRGTVEDLGTAAVISVKYTPSGATQQSTSFNVLQQANSKTKTNQDTGITLEISTIYSGDDPSCRASGDTWQVTASGESGGREEYTYTSGATQWISLGGTPITASDIAITTNGTGLSGSGTGAGANVTWASRGTEVGSWRSGTITASYSGVSVSETVYQQFNEVESVTDKVINWVKLDGTNGNIEVGADAGYTIVTVELGFKNHYTSGDVYSGTTGTGHTLSISGTGFSKILNSRVGYTENTAQSTRNGVVTITYGDATPVQRTITQAAASATTYQILGEVTYPSGSQIPASGGTATLTITKQTYINGVHQSASDVLIDCDSGYPYLVSQPTGCDVSITRTTTGTYSVSAESRGTVVNAGTDIEIDLQATIGGSAKTDSVTLVQQANALASSTNYQITSLKLDGTDDDIEITKAAQNITVTGSGTFTKTYTSGSTEGGTFNLGTGDISVSGTGFSYSSFTISAGANSGAERTCTVTASYTGASNVTRTITQAASVVAPTVALGASYSDSSSVTLVGNITDNGGGEITACGFQWGYTDAYGNNEPAIIEQSGEFSCQITGLNPEETIYFRAYATNSAGTSYSSGSSITTEGIVHGSITAAEFGNLYLKADVSILIYNDTFDSVNLGVITGYIKQGETTIGSAVFNSGSDIIISSGSSFSQTIAITTTGASELYIYYAKTSSIPRGVGILSLAVTPPPI